MKNKLTNNKKYLKKDIQRSEWLDMLDMSNVWEI